MVFLIDESGSNLLIGTAEPDELFGLAGADSISGLAGSDLLFGNLDSDTISGDQGDDIIYAGQDNDLIFGGQGSDRIFGDAGDDTISGDKGADILIGGSGSDVFVIDQGMGGFSLEEANIIPDFIVGEDIVKLGENLDVNQLSFEAIDSGNSTLIRNQDTGEYLLILQDVNILALTPESFDPPLPEDFEIVPPPTVPPGLEPPEDPPLPGTPPDIDVLPPSIEASLANDTGVDNSDGITSDITITGRATDDRGTPELEVSLGGEFVPISTPIAADGSFTLNQTQLEQAFGSPLADGDYTVLLRSVDESGLVSANFASIALTLDTTAPTITAQLANDTGDSNSDGITTDPTIVGTVTEANIAAFRVGSGDNLLNVSNQLNAEGGFEFDPLDLEAFLGEALVEDTNYTLELEVEDASGQVATTTVSFTVDAEPDETTPNIEPPPPDVVEMIDDDDDQIPPPPPEEREVIQDPGNTPNEALDIAVSSNTLIYSDQVSGDDPDDFYVFTLGAAGNISVDLNGLSSDADLVLLDSNQAIVDSSEAIGITSESITRPLQAGTYFIQVKSFDGGTTDYDLNVAFTSRLGIDLTDSGTEGGLFTDTSSTLINLEPPANNPDVNAFRTDPRFEGIDGSGFSVVVIDTGIDLDHPFFGPDSDGNGIADRIVYQYDFADDDPDASDQNDHGSNVTSIVASEDDIYTGMAPGANIIHLKVFADGSETFEYADLKQALSWVTENAEEYNIASVNMSLGGGLFSQALTPEVLSDALDDPTLPDSSRGIVEDYLGVSQLLEQIVAQDVIVVSASGNSFFSFESTPGVGYPSADINSLSVGAVWDSNQGRVDWGSGATDFTTDADRIASFSQRHPELTDIFAPGPFSTGANAIGGIVDQGGTSQASPHIAGIAALAQQLAVETIGRRLTFEEFRTLLQETGETIIDGDDEDDNVFNTGLEFPRVDVLALGEAILELDPTTEPPSEPGLVRYDFAYLYDGATLDDDFYLGYTYAEPGTFNLNTYYDDFPGTNEDGFNGLYFVFDDTGEVSSNAILDEVYVTGYFDEDASGNLYIPFYFENGFASGFDGLGSEYDFISLEDGTFDDFGFDFAEADGVEEIFSNDRFTRTDYDANSEPGRLVNADLDNDGADELIVANTSESESGFSLLFNQGDGSFEPPLDFITDNDSSGTGDDPSLDVGDIDGDGNVDLITVNPETNEVSIYFNDGNGNLFIPSTFEAGDRPIISETTDVDSDGNTDVVLINSEERDFPFLTGDSLSVLFNRTDNNNVTLTAGEGVTDVVAADLDGDGDVDLATANEVENTVSVLFNFGNIIFSSPFKFDVGDRPVSIVADDFDGNGTVDLATAGFGADTVSVLRNSGDGFFAPALTFETNENPSTMSAADIDGDGDSDLVMRNSVFFEDGDREGNSISVLLNNGDATFNPPVSFTVGEVPVGLIVEDLDGNGRLDIATSNFDSEDVTVYLQS